MKNKSYIFYFQVNASSLCIFYNIEHFAGYAFLTYVWKGLFVQNVNICHSLPFLIISKDLSWKDIMLLQWLCYHVHVYEYKLYEITTDVEPIVWYICPICRWVRTICRFTICRWATNLWRKGNISHRPIWKWEADPFVDDILFYENHSGHDLIWMELFPLINLCV